MKNKRLFPILLALFILIPSTTASADVVWNNEFLDKNKGKTIEIDRYFEVNSPNGSLTSKEAPGSRKNFYEREYLNGEIIYLTRIYEHRGEFWGIDADYIHGGPSGWFPMDELLQLYGYQDFDAEYQDEYYEYTGDFSPDYGDIAAQYTFWQWPGSDREKIILEPYDFKNLKIKHAYQDQAGREWGYAEYELSYYHFGYYLHSSWLCLSDPANESDIPAFNPAPAPTKWVSPPEPELPTEPSLPALPENAPAHTPENLPENTPADTTINTAQLPLIISIIVSLIAVTTILILVFKKPKK
jgi:hypothetical protein